MGDDRHKVECTQELRETLCVTFEVTFQVDTSVHVVSVECVGPCPPTTNGGRRPHCD